MIDPELLVSAAEEHGTPLFVYDLDAVADRFQALREALPPRVDVAYAVKANPAAEVLHRVAELGLGADVASGGELSAVCRAGFDPERVVFTGPGKRDAELDAAAELPLRAVTVESLGEMERLRLAARRAGSRVRVMVRAAGTDRGTNVIGAGNGRFGMRWVDLVEAARIADGTPELELVGMHRFEASNVLDADDLLGAARVTVEMASRLGREVGVNLDMVDLGGGLGIPYRDDDRPIDLAVLGAGLGRLLEDLDRDPHVAGARLLLEPGRYLVGPTGVYLARVIDVKTSAFGRVATIDGGIHHLLRPALVGQPHRIRLLETDAAERPIESVTVGGPLCTSLDVFARQIDLPALEPGDLVAILDAGAYGFTESMPFFLSHPLPAEVAISGGG
ncbi:MAG: diaminopimelate decarboxylase family protein [Candidatus Limnocylindria bacterium]